MARNSSNRSTRTRSSTTDEATNTEGADTTAAERGNGGGRRRAVRQINEDGKRDTTGYGDVTEDENRDTGNREATATNDRVWTQDSKERWGDGQPTLQDMLKEQRETDAAAREEGTGKRGK